MMKIIAKFIKYLTIALLLFVVVGSIAWAKLNLPYEGDLSNATLRRVHRINFRDGGDTLAQIYDVQITCQQLAARQLQCEHELAGMPLQVDVYLSESTSRIAYTCAAQYGAVAVPCQAYETIYTGGGLATPVVIINDGMPLSNHELSSLGLRYQWYSPFNLEFWLTYSYYLLIPLLTAVFAMSLWAKNESHTTRRVTITALASIPVSIALLFSTLHVMLSLYLVD